MKSSPVNTVSTGEKGLGHKEVRDGAGNHRRGLSEEGNSKIHEISKAICCESQMTTRTLDGLEKLQPQPQPPGPVVCWERFLPLRSLKVLLVENDDCTRHVVSALLRNCSYEVSSAENGVQAWKILQDPKNHIDLVLTEVVMPCLSGIGLLYKIMNHDYSKNIPVIMMSSHDSMGIVFKCLSKGAVDFLVKPIRKNELKNLWQHVWRRCHSSSGSGSESGTQSKRSTKVESVEGSDNDTGSNNENDNGCTEGAADESDNGSGTQSSWTKRAVDIGSLQAYSSCPDSASAQAILLKHEGSRRERVSATTREREEQDEESQEEVQMGKDLKIGVPGNQNLQNENSSEKVHPDLMNQDKLPFIDLGKASVRSNERALELDRGILSGEVRTLATADKISLISNCVDPAVETGFAEAPHGLLKPFEIKDKTTSDTEEIPSLELSLKRLRGSGDVGNDAHDELNVLRHSDVSAFSRYNMGCTANQAPTGNVGSCSPVDNSSDAMKAESLYHQKSNGSSNNNDMGSTTKNICTKPAAINDKSAAISTARCLTPSASKPPAQSGHTCPPINTPQKADTVVTTKVISQPRGSHQQVQVQHHHHHYHHHHYHVKDKQQQQPPPEGDDVSLNVGTSDVQCGSSNVFGAVEGNGGNYSLNGSVSGSNHASNLQNRSSKAANVDGMCIESDNGKTEAGGASGSGNSVEPNRFAQREAALNKFRQKRKDRCFEKKVRYQSRKKLAEQRPRVRGQFVRQAVYKHKSREENS